MKRLICAGIAALLVFFLPACGARQGEIGEETSVSPFESTGVPVSALLLDAAYTVIRGDRADAVEVEAALCLRNALIEAAGVEYGISTDWIGRGEEIPETAPEILVGETNRPESQAFREGLLRDDYVIAVSGQRVVLVGGSPAATRAAVEAFCTEYLGATAKELRLPGDLCLRANGSYATALTIAGVAAGKYTVVLPSAADRYLTYAAELLSDEIVRLSGAILPVVRDTADEAAHEIRLGQTSRTRCACPDNGCTVQMANGALELVGESSEIVYALRMILSAAEGKAEAELAPAGVATYDYVPPQYPVHELLAGRTPVALTDQKNAELAVIDLSAADPAAAAAQIWTWSPTAALGFSLDGYANSIDEGRLRYSAAIGSYVVCVTSSAGFMGVATFPAGEAVWYGLAKIGPHSAEYLPNGNVAVACSGNSDYDRGCIRIYAAAQSKTSTAYAEAMLRGAHGVLWDDRLGVLWGLGDKQIAAYRIGGTDSTPTLTEITSLGGAMPHGGGHDLSVDSSDPDGMWISGKHILRFDKRTGTFSDQVPAAAAASSTGIKTFGTLADGRMVRTVAADVFRAHDTDTLDDYLPSENGWTLKKITFDGRAFYKARLWRAEYTG